MPQFDAGAVVEPLRCKFKPLVDFDEVIKEPSDTLIGQFLSDMKKITSDAAGLVKAAEKLDSGDGEEPDPLAVLAALDDLDGDAYVEMMAEIAMAFSRLCQGRPSTEQLLALPLRARQLFFAWLTKEVVRPEAESADGAKVVSLPTTARTA